MNKIKRLIPYSALAIFAYAAYGADYTYDASGGGQWKTATWSPSVPTTGSENNITITHAAGGGNDSLLVNGALNTDTNNFDVGNMTVNIGTETGTKDGIAYTLFFNSSPYATAANAIKVDVNDPDYLTYAPTFKVNGNFTVNVYNPSDANNGKFSFRSNNQVGGIEITGDLTSNVVLKETDAVTAIRHVAFGDQYNDMGGATSANANTGFKLWRFKVGGNLELTNTMFSVATYHGINAEIGGIVQFNLGYNNNSSVLNVNVDRYDASRFIDPALENVNQTIKVGGLSSKALVDGNETVLNTGLITNSVGTTNAHTGTLEITGSGVYEFGGNTSDNNKTNANAKLSIVMSGSGTQILSGTNAHTGDTVVKNGKLLMATISSSSKLIVDGGKFGATGDNALSINNVEFSSGGFVFDLSKSNFALSIGTLTGDFTDAILDGFEFVKIADGTYSLISLTNENANFANLDGKTSTYSQDGIDYNAIFNATSTSLSVSFTQVPEPATYAAIFGALSLILVGYKKRRL